MAIDLNAIKAKLNQLQTTPLLARSVAGVTSGTSLPHMANWKAGRSLKRRMSSSAAESTDGTLGTMDRKTTTHSNVLWPSGRTF